jgi:hypothetical protein
MAESYTNEAAYLTYRQATQAVLDGKARIKELRHEWERTADRLRREIPGHGPEKRALAHAAVVPFQQQIEKIEEEIKENYRIADENFDIWKGLK